MASSTKVKKTGTTVSSRDPLRRPTLPRPAGATVKPSQQLTSGAAGFAPRVPAFAIQAATGWTPPAATPATPANPYGAPGSPATPDAAYNDATAMALRRRDERLTGLRTQGQTALKESGVSGQFDIQAGESGVTPTIAGLNIDDATLDGNPLSAAARLRDAYRRNASGSKTNLASRGQLYSGAMNNALNSLAKGHGDDRQSLINQVSKALGSYAAEGGNAFTNYLGEMTEAKGALTNRHEALRNAWTPEPTPEPAPAAAPAPAADPAAQNPWVQRGLKGPRGETLNVDNRGTWYRRKTDNKVIWVKRN